MTGRDGGSVVARARLAYRTAGEGPRRRSRSAQWTKLLFPLTGYSQLRPTQKPSPKLVGTMALARFALPTALITPVTASPTIKVQSASPGVVSPRPRRAPNHAPLNFEGPPMA